MKCPNCLSPVNFARKNCPRCGAAYQEAFESRARAEHERREQHRVPAHPRLGKPRAVPLAGVGALALAIVLWIWAAPPSGLPLPEGARATKLGFAYAAPAGWSVDPWGPSQRDERTSAVRLSRGTLRAEILVGPRSLSAVARSRDGARRLSDLEFNGDEIKVDAVEELEIDRLPAVRIKVSGGRVAMPSAQAGRRLSDLQAPAPAFESLPFAGEIVVVPGSGCSYLIKVWSDRDTLQRERGFIESLFGSFRVTRRPLAWGRSS